MRSASADLALRQLKEIAEARPGGVEVLDTRPAGAGRPGVQEIAISLSLRGIERAPGGAPVRDHERFLIEIDQTFPYAPPTVRVPHGRWAKIAHVQWERQLCLYAAPSVEWRPADGMGGLIERLLLWVEKAAAGELDSDDEPLHPPVAYVGAAPEFVVVHADLGDRVPWTSPDSGPTYLVAICHRSGDRFDIIEWQTPDALDLQAIVDESKAGQGSRVCAAVILVDGDLGFEYPQHAGRLAEGLELCGVTHDALLDVLATVATANSELAAGGLISPTIVIIGTPHRGLRTGRRNAHLVAWRLDGAGETIADLLAATTQRRVRAAGGRRRDRAARLEQLGEPYFRKKVRELCESWLAGAGIDWLRVLENRAEVTVRRDSGSSTTWLAGKRIVVLGCGALGAPVAEHCLRANAASVVVVDNGYVTPGILVRQPYTDADVGRRKAYAMVDRLKAIRPTADVKGRIDNLITLIAGKPTALTPFDIIIDATADSGVRAALEAARLSTSESWPTVVSLLIGHEARRGVAAISRPDATGCGHDIFRRLGLTIRAQRRDAMADIADDFYPDPPRSTAFQPEPGCSAPTFTGSAAEAGALAAALLSAALDAITGRAPAVSQLPMSLAAVRLGPAGRTDWVGWDNDLLLTERHEDLQVRISRPALSEIRAEARRGARVRGEHIETGGMLIGRIDEAVGCIFIDAATGPPPDSRLSNVYFEHGTSGAQQAVDRHIKLSKDANGFVGMWHTHPGGPAAPSPTDQQGMAGLVTPVAGGPTHALMLIVGGPPTTWTAWRDGRQGALPEMFAQLVRRADAGNPGPTSPPLGTYHRGGFSQRAQAAPPKLRWWRRLLRLAWAGR